MIRLANIAQFLLLILVIASCHNKITCPAYQSQFILDEEKFKEKFSLFEADSTPKRKLGKVKKSKYGIIVQKSYKRKFNEMKTVPMETVYPESPDSLMMIAWAIPDSLVVDSLGSRPVYYSPYLTLFNNDQALYDAMYGHLLKPSGSTMQEIKEDLKVEEPEVIEQEERKKKKFRLFGKKKEEEPAEGGKRTDDTDQ